MERKNTNRNTNVNATSNVNTNTNTNITIDRIKKIIQSLLNNYKFHLIPIISILIYTILFYIIYFKYPTSFDQFSNVTNILFIFVGLCIFLYTFVYYLKTASPYYTIMKYFKQIGIMLLMLLLIFGFIYLTTTFDGFSYLLTFIVNVGIIITFLGLLYFGLEKIPFLKKLKESNLFKMIYNSIFLLPSYLLNSFAFLNKDIKNTPSYIFKLLIIQVLFIISYFVIPIIISKVFNNNGIILLKKPKYLDNKHNLGKYENFIDSPKNNDDIFNYSYNYGISFWMYIDEQGPNRNENSNKYTSVFDYGNKPNILYNADLNKIKVTMKTGNVDTPENIVTVYESDKNEIPLQKWNYYVINYNSGILDVFINNKLVASKSNIMPYMNYDDVISGEENGVSGGISNVLYFKTPITKTTMYWNYRALKNKKLPYL